MDPSGPPPSYDTATGSAPSNTGGTSTNVSKSHKTRNGIPPLSRRSMEDEARELPQGWVRQFDPQEGHQYYVDTTKDPPRSIWSHPYDDHEYIMSLPASERARISGLHRHPSEADIVAESSGDDEFHDSGLNHGKQTGAGHQREHFPSHLPEREDPPPTGIHKFGRKMKDKITSSTHQEREQQRQQRAIEEQKTYERHQVYRAAMVKAAQTGEPQLIGKDKDGKDVYIEPPYSGGPIGGMGDYPGQGGYGHGRSIGYSPYQQGPYAQPNARYIRPAQPYMRPYGMGYGGGMGLPIGLGLGAGMLGGGMLGAGMMGGGMMGGGGMLF